MRMEQNDLRKAFPKTPEFIVEMIENTVQEQMKEAVMKRSFNYYVLKTAVMVSVCCLLLGGTAYAVTRLWKLSTEETGEYGATIKMEGVEGTVIDKIYVFRGDYLPEGMEWEDIGTSKIVIKNPEEEYSSATIMFTKLQNGAEWVEKAVMEYEAKDINGHQVILLKKEKRDIYYVVFEEEQLLLELSTEKISQKEAERIIEHISLAETTDEWAENRVWTMDISVLMGLPWPVGGEDMSVYEEHDFTTYSCTHEDMKNLHQIGDRVQVTGLVEATVTKVEISDNKAILNTDGKYARQSQKESLFDAQGKLKNATIQYVKRGDGINTLDQVVYEEEVPMKLVSIEVEYKNTSEWELEDVKINNRLITVQEKGDEYQLKSWERGDIEYDSYSLQPYSVDYSVVLDYYGGKGWENVNTIPEIGVGESKTVCWIYAVAEEDLPYLYLDLADYGEYYALKGLNWVALEKGLVDIRQK